MRLAILAIALLTTFSAIAAPKCDFEAAAGEGFTIRQPFDAREWGPWIHRFSTEPKWQDPYRLPSRGLAGTKGKILKEAPIRAEGEAYYRVLLADCRQVYMRLLNGKVTSDIYTDSELRAASSFIGKTLWAKQYGVRNPTIFTLDEDVSYVIEDGAALRITGVYTKIIPHSYGADWVMLIVKDAKGREGYYPFNSLYLSVTRPTPAELRERAKVMPSNEGGDLGR